MNSNLLKSKIILKGREDFVQAIADLLGISRVTASKRLSGEGGFTDHEMRLIKAEYDLSSEDVVKIFLEDPDETLSTSETSS